MIQLRRKTMLKLFSWRPDRQALLGIASPNAFHAVLERERARVDRHGREFSLVLFDVGKTDGEPTRPLARVLTNRTRSIDQVGWLDGRCIGAVLPDTPAEGARKFAEDVCKAIATYTSPPVFRVFTYPSQWLQGNNGDPTQLSNTDIPKGSKASQANESTNLMDGLGHLLGYHMPGWKRFIDVVGALFGLILLFPVFLLIAILIKIVSSGPVFFKQERLGYLGRPFTCWKFRTMKIDADIALHQKYLSKLINAEEPMTKLDEGDDTRIIPMGKFLRQTGLDELPQLFHVLFGEMSLIGPRPCIPYEAQEYLLWHRKRFDTMPGLSGLWQVSGKNKTTFKEMMRLDIKYLGQRSLWLDLKILLKTVPTIIALGIDSFFRKREEEYGQAN